jgi:uncharacterized protein with HEPN domain
MSRDNWIYVAHMLDVCQQALELAESKTREDYNQDLALRLALTHLIQVIGEAAQHVEAGFRFEHEQVPWREVIGMRHRIVHDYLNVDEDIIWEVVQQDLPQLASQLKQIVPEEYQ